MSWKEISMLVWSIFTRIGFHLDVVVALRKRWCCTSPKVESSSSSFLTSPSAVLTPSTAKNLCEFKNVLENTHTLQPRLCLKLSSWKYLLQSHLAGLETGLGYGNRNKTMKISWKVSNSPLCWAAVGHQITWVPCTSLQYPYCATACGKTMLYNTNLRLFGEVESIFFYERITWLPQFSPPVSVMAIMRSTFLCFLTSDSPFVIASLMVLWSWELILSVACYGLLEDRNTFGASPWSLRKNFSDQCVQ